MIEVRTLQDGAQPAEEVGAGVVEFLDRARRTLDIALYDVRLPGEVGDRVRGALEAAAGRGVDVRLLYNRDEERGRPLPPPPDTRPELIEALPFATRGVPGEPDLMHHKYVVRDSEAVWTGSANWTRDAWEREENVIATVESAEIAGAYGRDFEQLWRTREVQRSGDLDPQPERVGEATVRAWFCPGRGRELSQRIAGAIGRARRRVRIASPVVTAGPVLGTLAEEVAEGELDLAGVVDATHTAQVFDNWAGNPRSTWKAPLLRRVLGGRFSGKRSTPYSPGSVHDYMHAKLTVADDTVFLGSFNLSRSGELNAENVLEIADAGLAGRLAAYVDELRERYPDPVP